MTQMRTTGCTAPGMTWIIARAMMGTHPVRGALVTTMMTIATTSRCHGAGGEARTAATCCRVAQVVEAMADMALPMPLARMGTPTGWP